ncbi:hypothetical protein STAS_27803 [Striga asiatica]|uniref:Uncharacterized protein n=1 Tax=Striga asiatica TaxID=4170 RepID=A0A5A7QZF3_STRAF|nr:hypothetical protein STAS_27803 [Striga asiatica]
MSSSRGSWNSRRNSENNGAPMEMTCNCRENGFGYCGFFICNDPEICERAKNITPGLLEKSNKHQYQIEQYKLKNDEMEAQLLVAMNKVNDMNNALVVCKNKIKKLLAAIILLSLLYLLRKRYHVFKWMKTLSGVVYNPNGHMVEATEPTWNFIVREEKLGMAYMKGGEPLFPDLKSYSTKVRETRVKMMTMK